MPTIPQAYIARGSLSTPDAKPLSSIQINTGAAGRLSAVPLRAPALTAPRVSAPQYSAAQTPDIIGPAVTDLGKTIGRVAMAMADRTAELQSGDALNEFDNRTRSLWLGGTDERGEFRPGYAATSSRQAAEGFSDFQSSVAQARVELASRLDDAAKAKFLAKSNSSYQAVLNSAANHAQAATRTWEAEQRQALWQNAFIRLDDKLVVGDLPGAAAVLHDTGVQAASTYPATPMDRAENLQTAYQQAADYLASTPDSVTKLQSFTGLIDDSMSLETRTRLNNILYRAMAEEEAAIERQLAKAERDRTARSKVETIQMYALVDEGRFDDARYKQLRNAGVISQSDYTAAQRRAWGQEYYMPAEPGEKYEYMQQINEGLIDASDIQGQAWPKSDRDYMLRYLNNTATETKRNEYREASNIFEDALTQVGIPSGPGYANRYLAMQEEYNKRRETVGHHQALNEVLAVSGLTADYTPTSPVAIPGYRPEVPVTLEDVKRLATQLELANEGGVIKDPGTYQSLLAQLTMYRNQLIHKGTQNGTNQP